MNKRLILTACFLTVFIAYAVRYGYGILLPEMLDSLGITKTDAGIIFSSFFIAYTIASPICGYIADRYGSRWLLASFVAALGVGAFLMSYATSILQASLFFTLAGMGSAACWAPVMALAQKWTSHEHRGQTLAFIDVGSALSIIVMAALVPVIIRNLDWRAGWMILGLAAIAIGIFNFLVVKNPPDEQLKNQKTPEKAGVPLPVLLKSGRFWLLGLGYLFTGFSILVPFTFLNTYAVQELNLSFDVASYLMIALGVSAIVSKVVFGPISDRTGRLKMIFLCGSLIALGCLGMAYRNTATLFIAVCVFALGYGVVWALYAAAASDYFAKESSGTIVGIWTLFLGVGSVLSPIIAGWVADATGTLTWSFGVGAAGGLVSVLLLIPLWQHKQV
jgi:MFS family permease